MDVFNEMFLQTKGQKYGQQPAPSDTEQAKPTSGPRTPLPNSPSSSEQTPAELDNLFKDIQPIKGLAPFPPPKGRAAEKTQGEDKATLERLWKEVDLKEEEL
jgi:hypothetical protein